MTKAGQSFTKAISIDPKYFPAYANLACLYIIDNQLDKAKELLKKFEKFSNDSTGFIVLNNIEGILLFKDNMYNDCKELFKQNASVSSIASKNYKILKGTQTEGKKPKEIKPESLMIGGNSYSDARNFLYEIKKIKSYSEEIPIEVGIYNNNEDWYALQVVSRSDNKGYYFLVANKGYNEQISKSLKIGSSREDVIKAYSEPDFEFKTASGSLIVYDYLGIALKIDDNNRVSGFVIF